jgi:cobalt-zinc-cadmium efflux system outer membrane protein
LTAIIKSFIVGLLSAGFLWAQEPSELPAKLDLGTAESLLYQNNLSVIAARHGVDANRAARLAATYTPNPTLTVGAEQFKTDRRLKSYAADTGTGSNPTYTFRIDQLLETGGKKRKRTEVADSQLLASEAQVLDLLRTQTLQLKQSFYGALLARENNKTAKDALESISSTEQLMMKQAKQGNIPDADVIKFQANKIQYDRDVATSQLTYTQAVRDIVNTLAAKTPANLSVAGGEPVIELVGELVAPTVEFNLNELHKLAEERADVIAAKRVLEAAEKSVELASAGRWQDVTLGGEYQRVGSDNTVGVVVSVPLPLYNNHKANICQAEAMRNQSFAQYTQVKLQAITDVDKAYQGYLSSRKIVALYADGTLSKAKESLDIVQKSYDRRAASLLDLLDAQRTYKQTLLAAHQAQYDALISLATLESAVGRKKENPQE